ncbi:MAG: hypothetical protein COY01_03180 [Candidatus Pacebacteria bacterium CG_4_10_14_0_2_um_filter_40_20]|nr:MAG: hypothetical protein COY01_03180 [Candidatus Pacebacteria bacterium CG_4_10_14_0_2_um_filter_40_20]
MNFILGKYYKSLVSGGISGLIHLFGLFYLHEIASVHYLISSIIAFSFAIVFNYLMQKKWVFKSSEKKIHIEFILFIITAGLYLILNTVLLYLAVSILKAHYLFSQAVIIIFLSGINFYLYKKIFRKQATRDFL